MADFVEIKKGNKKKSVPKAQWDAMLKNKATYGWTLASDLPAEVLKKDKDVQASVVEKLKTEIAGLKATIGEKDLKIEELEAELKAYMASDDIKTENINTLEKALENVAPKGTPSGEPKADKKPLVTAPPKKDASDVKANTDKGGKKNSGK